MKVINFRFKKNIIPCVFCLFIIFLVAFSNQNLIASKNGLILWATCLVPSLFPFLVATELLNYTNIPNKLGNIFSKIMYPIFNLPGESAYAFIMGIICGYPVGAKIVSKFYSENTCTKEQAERMLAFTNNSGPLFIIGTVGISLFCNFDIGILLFCTHILSSISVGVIFSLISRFKALKTKTHPIEYRNCNPSCSLSSLGDILSNSINSAISTILLIGGFVILFSVVICIINNLNILNYFSNLFGNYSLFVKTFFTGIIELTNGVDLCSDISGLLNIRIVLCSVLLGFGGFSVMLQILSIISKAQLSIKWYLYGKILQGIFAGVYTYILLNSFIWRFFYG